MSRISEYEISKIALNDLVISLHGFVAGEVHIRKWFIKWDHWTHVFLSNTWLIMLSCFSKAPFYSPNLRHTQKEEDFYRTLTIHQSIFLVNRS